MAATNKTQNTFSLFRLKKSCYYPLISVDFTPLPKPNLGNISITPQFNNDSNYFTDAFVNPYEEARHFSTHEKDLEVQKEKFLQKVKNSLSQPAEEKIQFNPKRDNYCSLCGKSFECYWEHINATSHQGKIKRNKANSYIHELCDQYSGQKNKKMAKGRGKGEKQQKQKSKKINKCKKDQPIKYEYRPQDFLINLPRQFISKDLIQGSTNGALSLQQKH